MDVKIRALAPDREWTKYSIEGAESLADAAYQAVRQKFSEWLTDSNHTYKAEDKEIVLIGKTVTYRRVSIYQANGIFWFSVAFR